MKNSFLLLVPVLLFVMTGTAFANTHRLQVEPIRTTVEEKRVQNTQIRNEAVREAATTRQETRTQRQTDRCELLDERVSLWITRYTNNLARLERVEARVFELIRTTIARAQTAGKDTTSLEEKSEILAQKASIAKTEYRVLIEKLTTAGELSCSDDPSAFGRAIADAQQQMKIVRRAVLDARVYYQSEIKPEIRKLLAD